MSLKQPNLENLPPSALLIGTEQVSRTSGGRHAHIYPGTGTTTREIPLAGADDVNRAVAAAREAYSSWRLTPPDERRRLLLRLAARVREHADELTSLAITENGTAHDIARRYPDVLADKVEYNAGWADKIGGEVIPMWPARALDYTIEEPYGVVGIIVTWNSPLGTAGMTLAPALAAGNCVILKAPELAPWSSLRLGTIALDAGFPPGVINVVPAGPDGSSALVRHPDVDFVHFTGSGRTARFVLEAAAETLKPVGLELGGKSPRILFADGDLDAAIDETVAQIGKLAGQGCLNGMRMLVEDTAHDEFVTTLADRMSALSMGDPYDPDTEIGPVISADAVERIVGMIERARADGARLVVGGERAGGPYADGFFVTPTLFTDVDPSWEINREEVFGPVVSVTRFATEEEAIRLANDTPYGLGAYVWTRDIQRAHLMADAIQAGNVWLNGYAGLPASMPFGGHKQSGYGRLGGRHAIQEFTRTKNVWTPLSR